MVTVIKKLCDICQDEIAPGADRVGLLQIMDPSRKLEQSLDLCAHCVQLALRMRQSIFRRSVDGDRGASTWGTLND